MRWVRAISAPADAVPAFGILLSLKGSSTMGNSTRVPTCRYRGRAPAIKDRANTRKIARLSFLTTTHGILIREAPKAAGTVSPR